MRPEILNALKALDAVRAALESMSDTAADIAYPQLAISAVERVLAFECVETHRLMGAGTAAPYFSAEGVMTDLANRPLSGSRVVSMFPLEPARLGESFVWPPVQSAPYGTPPLDTSHVTAVGYTKQLHSFEDGSSFVTVGPALPKIALLKNGGAQFWVDGTGVMTQGTGVFEHAKGMAVYLGSAYFPAWPSTLENQVQLLAAGYKVVVSSFVKYVVETA